MSIEVRPLGVTCNIACQYCYQNPIRDAGHSQSEYNYDAVIKSLAKVDENFNLFGGEPLLLDIAELEKLWLYGYQKYQINGVQTNGVLVTQAHCDLFKKYNVQVGISLDGPGELNNARWAGSQANTIKATQKSLHAIELLLQNGIVPGLMIQLNQLNAIDAQLDKLCDWLIELDSKGIQSARIHILEIENESMRETLGLSPEQNIIAFNRIDSLHNELNTLRLDTSYDRKLMLMMQDDDVACVWRACDQYTTEAVYGIDGNGDIHNCGLTDKEGINFQKPETPGYERYIALYNTAQEHGGCQSCRFFAVCKGHCPGTAIQGDWRNRSEFCEVWKFLLIKAEKNLIEQGHTPLSQHPQRTEVEQLLVANWAAGFNIPLSMIKQSCKIDLGELIDEW